MNLRYTSRSKDDIDTAFEWYERQYSGLGFDFLDSIELSIKLIIKTPEMYRCFYSHFRGCVIRRFPFTIFYTIEGQTIVVHSVFDNRQDPDKHP